MKALTDRVVWFSAADIQEVHLEIRIADGFRAGRPDIHTGLALGSTLIVGCPNSLFLDPS